MSEKMRNKKLGESHLMYRHIPFSACGWYLPDHSGMRQVFKIEHTSCKRCLKKWEEYKIETIKSNPYIAAFIGRKSR